MNKTEFKVGDKVVRNFYHAGTHDIGTDIGTIVKITSKRKDIVVDYGNYKETYDMNGWQKSASIWYQSRIILLTPEIEKEITNKIIIDKCKSIFSKTKLTVDQATKILEILENKNGTEK